MISEENSKRAWNDLLSVMEKMNSYLTTPEMISSGLTFFNSLAYDCAETKEIAEDMINKVREHAYKQHSERKKEIEDGSSKF